MHIHIVPNRGSPPTVLLRESYREGRKVGKRTLANLSSLSAEQIDAMRAALRGEPLQPVAQCFEVIASPAHGHVQAVSRAMQRLGFANVIAAKPGRERDLVLAMVAARILAPHTKLATTRWWRTTTLAEDFGVADADEDDLYAAMDWLLERQDTIERKLAARHLSPGALVLYDLSSSYFEGSCCPLAKLGHNRDGKSGLLQVNYGLLTDARGCPVAVSVHEGNVADSKTSMPALKRLRQDLGVQQLVMVGDQGMISSKAVAELRQTDGVGWITALKTVSIRALVEQKSIGNSNGVFVASRRSEGYQAGHEGSRGTNVAADARKSSPVGAQGTPRLSGTSVQPRRRQGLPVGSCRSDRHSGLAVQTCPSFRDPGTIGDQTT